MHTTDTTLKHLTPENLASRWEVTVGHLSNLRGKGKGPAFLKLGRAVRYPLVAIEEYEKAALVQPVYAYGHRTLG